MSPTYPDVASRLLEVCDMFRRGQVELAGLKAAVWSASGEIALPQERPLREFLQHAEGRLDMAEFTVDDDELPKVLDDILLEVEAELRRYLLGGTG